MQREQVLRLCIHDVKRLFFVAEDIKNRDAIRTALAINNPKAFLEVIEPKKIKVKFEQAVGSLISLAGNQHDKRKLAMRRVAMEYEKKIRRN